MKKRNGFGSNAKERKTRKKESRKMGKDKKRARRSKDRGVEEEEEGYFSVLNRSVWT
jgi:hypothetical protein